MPAVPRAPNSAVRPTLIEDATFALVMGAASVIVRRRPDKRSGRELHRGFLTCVPTGGRRGVKIFIKLQ